MEKICSCRVPTRPKLSHFSLQVQTGTLGCKRLKIKRRISFATRLISLRPSHANFDFLFPNFAVRDLILFTLDFNTQPEMHFNRKLKFVLMRSAFCRGVGYCKCPLKGSNISTLNCFFSFGRSVIGAELYPDNQSPLHLF